MVARPWPQVLRCVCVCVWRGRARRSLWGAPGEAGYRKGIAAAYKGLRRFLPSAV
jgi:hypothetical protein